MEAMRFMYQTNDMRSICKLLSCYAVIFAGIDFLVDDGPMIGILLFAVGIHFVWSALKVVWRRMR